MEEQERDRFHKFLENKAFTCLSTEQARKVFLAEFKPDNQGRTEENLAEDFYIAKTTYKKHKTEMYNQLGLTVESRERNRKAYFRQLLKEFSESPSEQERKRSEIEQLNLQSKSLFSSNDQLGALLAVVKAGKKLQEIQAPGDLKMQTVCNLWEVLYKIRERNCLHGHSHHVYSVSFSPDGEMIASASKDGTVKLWRKDGTLLKITPPQGGFIYSVCFSPNEKMIAFAGSDRTTGHAVTLWHWDDNKLTTFPQGHRLPVYSVSFSRDGQTIASASDDGTVNLWNLNGELTKAFSGSADDSSIRSVSFSPHGQMIAFIDDWTIKIYSLKPGTAPKILQGHKGLINSVSFSPDSQTLASASTDGTVKRWSLADSTELFTFPSETKSGKVIAVSAVSFSWDGKMIAWANNDGTLKLWNGKYSPTYEEGSNMLVNKPDVQTFQVDSKWINSISFSDDDKAIALGGNDSTVKLWSLKGTEVKTLKLWHMYDKEKLRFPMNPSEQSSLHPDGQTLASASHDGTVKLQNHQDDQVLHTFETDCLKVSSVNFSSDGNTLTITGIDGKEIQWNLNLEDLLNRGCNWLSDYLKTNPNISESDRLLCNEIDS